jgi:NADPH-dependent glutamate synthase beta subunit-like oxidoreductase
MTEKNAQAAAATEGYDEYDEYGDCHYLPAPCQSGCPVGTDIPSYVALVWEGKYDAAWEVIAARNPFASTCGRVCAKPCETQCRRGESDGAVAIRNLKRFVTERVGSGFHLPPVPVTKAKTVAIVGSGPAGLTAARDLAEEGYAVHVYEKENAPGGMMTRGIPAFRLPHRFVEEDIQRLLDHCPGIRVRLNCEVGNQISMEELKNRHDAVLLSIGLWKDRPLSVPGEEKDLEGLHGIDFLTGINSGKLIPLSGRVVVVGGGNVAIDVARTALRAGAGEVQLFCLEKRDDMPAWEHEVEDALSEGIVINPSWGPKQIHHKDGKVTGIELMRCTSVFDGDGCFNPSFDPKITRTVETGAILVSIGLTAENSELERMGIMARGRVRADFESMRTADPKVFAAGDGAFGPSAIVHAIHHGHRAAHYIKAFLEGREDPPPYRVTYDTRKVPVAQDPMWEKISRDEQVTRGMGEDPSAMLECTLTYDLETAKRQAARCLRCDAETGTANYTRRSRELIHAMARTGPEDAGKQGDILQALLRPRQNPFPPERPPQLDDLVFLPAALTRLVIDPYREHCSTTTRIGEAISLKLPYFVTGFDAAPEDVRSALSGALAKTGCGYIGFEPLPAGFGSIEEGTTGDGSPSADHVPWLQLVARGKNPPNPEADGVVHVVKDKFTPVSAGRLRSGQIIGICATAAALPEAIPYALENGFDVLVLDGSDGMEESPASELKGPPDLTVIRDALRILRELNREEDIALLYFGGLRTGTDVAKGLALNCNAGVFGAAMAIAMGGVPENGQMRFRNAMTSEERRIAAQNWLKATGDESAIIARCTGKTNVHNLEPEDMRTITLATSEATDIPLASGRPPREYF